MIPECSIAASGGSAPTDVGQINSLDLANKTNNLNSYGCGSIEA